MLFLASTNCHRRPEVRLDMYKWPLMSTNLIISTITWYNHSFWSICKNLVMRIGFFLETQPLRISILMTHALSFETKLFRLLRLNNLWISLLDVLKRNFAKTMSQAGVGVRKHLLIPSYHQFQFLVLKQKAFWST